MDVHPNAPRRPPDAGFLYAVQRHHPQLHVDDVDLWEYIQSVDAQVDHCEDGGLSGELDEFGLPFCHVFRQGFSW